MGIAGAVCGNVEYFIGNRLGGEGGLEVKGTRFQLGT